MSMNSVAGMATEATVQKMYKNAPKTNANIDGHSFNVVAAAGPAMHCR